MRDLLDRNHASFRTVQFSGFALRKEKSLVEGTVVAIVVVFLVILTVFVGSRLLESYRAWKLQRDGEVLIRWDNARRRARGEVWEEIPNNEAR